MSAALAAVESTRTLPCRAVELTYDGFTKAGNPSHKFWRGIVIPGGEHRPSYFVTQWGKTGTTGQTTVKAFATDYAARSALSNKQDEKYGKGYLTTWSGLIRFEAGLAFFAELGRNGIFASDLNDAFDAAR